MSIPTSGDDAVTETSDAPPPVAPPDALYTENAEEREFEVRAEVASFWTGGRLMIGVMAFLFASLAFAYFYLRSSNSGLLWRPDRITAPTGLGWTIYAVVLASVLLTMYGQARMRAGTILDWEVSGWVAVGGMLFAVALQIWQLTQLPFFPGSSGYASCFIGWAVLNTMMLLSGAYWLETDLALCIRLRHRPSNGGSLSTAADPAAQLFRANVDACTYYFGFILFISTLFWVFFYLI